MGSVVEDGDDLLDALEDELGDEDRRGGDGRDHRSEPPGMKKPRADAPGRTGNEAERQRRDQAAAWVSA